MELFKKSHKYIRTYKVEDAYRRHEFSKMVHVPVTFTSKVKRSRIKDVKVAIRVYLNIEQFNEKHNLQKELSDIPVNSNKD
jgi:hypothetical protein